MCQLENRVSFLRPCRWFTLLGLLALLAIGIPRPALAQTNNESPPKDRKGTVENTVRGLSATNELKEAVVAVVRQHPTENVWTGQAEKLLFSLVVEDLATGQAKVRSTPMLAAKARLKAITALLQTKALLKHFQSAGLTDATTLRLALRRVSNDQSVSGRVEGINMIEKAANEYLLSLVYAPSKAVHASMTTDAVTEEVRRGYREVMHQQSLALMEAEQWEDAVLLWRHLHRRKLVSPILYLGAATCFYHLNRQEDAIDLLKTYLNTCSKGLSSAFLERAGKLAEQVESEKAQQLAAKAYRLATERFSIVH